MHRSASAHTVVGRVAGTGKRPRVGLGFVAIALCLASLCLATLSLSPTPAHAQSTCPDAPQDGVLRIAVREAPPFTQRGPIIQEGWDGIAVQLWEAIATELDVEYRYVELGLDEGMQALEDCEVEVVISPLTITAAREARFDFSQQYFRSGLTLVGPPPDSIDLNEALDTMLATLSSSDFVFSAAILLGLILLFVLAAVRNQADYSHAEDLEGLGLGTRLLHFFMYTFVTATGLSDEVFAFRKVRLQLLSFIAVIIGTAVSGSVIGLIAASMTSSLQSEPDFDIDHLDGYTVVTLEDSTAEDFLLQRHGRYGQRFEIVTVPTLEEAVDEVAAGRADLALGDWAQLSFLTRREPHVGELFVQEETLRFEPYGWGFAQDSTWREPVNREMIGILRSAVWKPLVRRYMGEGDITPD